MRIIDWSSDVCSSDLPDIIAARWRAEAAAKRIDVAHAQFYPSVNLLGFIGLDALGLRNIANGGADTGSVGAALNLPIFAAGDRESLVEGTSASVRVDLGGPRIIKKKTIHKKQCKK